MIGSFSSDFSSVYAQLTSFAKLENFWSLFDTAFGSSYDFATAASLRSQWQGGDFSLFPQIEIVSSDVLGTANGAYAISTNRIYLSDRFVSSASQQSLDAVILEEFGHFVDAQVNTKDTPGDEGELFSDLVRGVKLSPSELTRIQTEDDLANIVIDNHSIQIEQANDYPIKQWTKLLGTSNVDLAYALTTGNDGAIYVSGHTNGDLDGQTNNGNFDAFITKYNPDGTKVWTKLLGTSGYDYANELTTGNDGAIYVSGHTNGDLDGQTNNGNFDAFITKYNPDGSKVWTKLLGTSGDDEAFALTTGNDGAIYVSGNTTGNLDGQTNNGNFDVFITKYNPNGTKVWTKLLGTSGYDYANALTTGNDGAIYVSGFTTGNLDGQTNSGYSDTFITKYNPDGTKVWTKLLGTSGYDPAYDLTTGKDGAIYVSGSTGGNLDGQTNNGYDDAFIAKYNPDGTKVWTKLLGTSYLDAAFALTTGNDGAIYVSGYAGSNLDGQTNSGYHNAFITKYNPDGTKVWTKFLGTSSYDQAFALTTGKDGAIYVSGDTQGYLDGGQTNNGGQDVFITKYQDVPAVNITLAVASASVTEDGTPNLVYTFTRTGDLTNALTVNYSIAGTATNGTDYATIGTSVTFVANSATATVTVNPTADTTIENNETVALTLATGIGYTIGTTTAVTGTITNDDVATVPNITLAVAPVSVLENGTPNLVYTFTRTGATTNALTVNYGITGTADAIDYTGATPGTGKTITFAAGSATATLTVDPTADTTIEANETVALTLATGTGYTVGTTTAVTGTITNDDFPSITLAVAPASVLEDGTPNLIYTFTRTGPITNALTVNYGITGTAINGTDYATIGTSVTFAANSATATVTVNPTVDTTIENNETVALTLATGTGYAIGTTTAVTGTITNDDFPSITLAIAPASVLEDGTPNLIYTFTRTGPITNALTVNYGITGTAINGTDYATIGTSVNFAANSATATVTVNPTVDTTIENNETVALTLATGTGYTIGTTTAVTGTITNDDVPIISLGLNYSAISEDSPSNFIYTFTRTGATTNALTVNYSIAGNALSTDYTGATPGTGKTITFAAGSATATLILDPTADTTLEPNETVTLQLASGTGYTINTTAAQTATIVNDDNTRNQQGTNGNSILLGKNYSDYLTGGTGNDILNGAGNSDYLTGGVGNDNLTGGIGGDTFFFANANLGIDTITDFTPNEDTIFISAPGFGSGLIAGNPLTQNQFILGSSTTSASQRFIYNSTNGALLFDADGNGLGTAKQIATLSIGLALTSEDIFVG